MTGSLGKEDSGEMEVVRESGGWVTEYGIVEMAKCYEGRSVVAGWSE